jgi:hypothetical protein
MSTEGADEPRVPCVCKPWTEADATRARGYGFQVHRLTCAGCGAPLIASAATVQVIADGTGRPVCFPCFEKDAKPVTAVVMTPAMAQELARAARIHTERN